MMNMREMDSLCCLRLHPDAWPSLTERAWRNSTLSVVRSRLNNDNEAMFVTLKTSSKETSCFVANDMLRSWIRLPLFDEHVEKCTCSHPPLSIIFAYSFFPFHVAWIQRIFSTPWDLIFPIWKHIFEWGPYHDVMCWCDSYPAGNTFLFLLDSCAVLISFGI